MDSEIAENQAKERLRTRWTASLDKIFADLVVEQIQVWNRPNNIFDKKTWGHIRDEFNKRTSLNFNNNQLRKHLDVLRTRYNHMKSALGHHDLVIEDSYCLNIDLWDGIGVNPGPEPAKTKECPIYEQLCIIFADDGADGRYARSSHYEKMGHRSIQSSTATPYHECIEANAVNTVKGTRSNFEKKRKRFSEVNQFGENQSDVEVVLEPMARALLDMIASSRINNVAFASAKERFSITNCVKALDEIEGVAESVYFASLDLFDDENLRETFVSLKSKERRSEWLKEKCSF